LYASAIMRRASALLDLGKGAEALSAYQQALRVFAAAGHQKMVAKSLNSMAVMADNEGD
jgi:hypothetical protein